MVLALPEATTTRYTPQATFDNIHGDTIATEQALEATARVYMDSEYATGGNRMEAIVTSLLRARWQRVHGASDHGVSNTYCRGIESAFRAKERAV